MLHRHTALQVIQPSGQSVSQSTCSAQTRITLLFCWSSELDYHHFAIHLIPSRHKNGSISSSISSSIPSFPRTTTARLWKASGWQKIGNDLIHHCGYRRHSLHSAGPPPAADSACTLNAAASRGLRVVMAVLCNRHDAHANATAPFRRRRRCGWSPRYFP